ncbi:hypothetical protein [uncultured Gimesia sp.]|uniref:hypothetical protein n=1 Tax=uncultured Gimesia sp. TaxID=1678688 RepID=UPI0030D7526A|tara:strand:- start:34846 stop:35280 length:435 start_codon:yes stop_codon:yes gene_type:complete
MNHIFLSQHISKCFLLCLCFVISGCGGGVDDAPTLYPVKGTIKKDGQGIKDIRVSFVPAEDGIPAVGVSGEDGSYELSNPKGGLGAQAGTYKVVLSVTASEAGYSGGGDPSKSKLPFPKSYSSKTTTPKSAQVKAGENVVDIEF